MQADGTDCRSRIPAKVDGVGTPNDGFGVDAEGLNVGERPDTKNVR